MRTQERLLVDGQNIEALHGLMSTGMGARFLPRHYNIFASVGRKTGSRGDCVLL